jgi:hypothetical protein
VTELLALAAGLGFGAFFGYFLGERGGLRFVKEQLALATSTTEKLAQVMVAPYGGEMTVTLPESDPYADLTSEDERVPEWMEDEPAQAR